jgi:glycosyltransferase involved in cell wall biosynthesis
MKLLVFAHTPPPHHGQSYMVDLMLKNFGGDQRSKANRNGAPLALECYHVNARFSHSLENIGEFQAKKLLLIVYFCLEAIWCRFRHGVTNLYYIPAPGKSVALYRDWLVLFLCRPFFKKIVLHWHAAGMAKWLETSVQMRTRSLTYRWFKEADLSIVISNYNMADAEKLRAKKIRVVSNGIPDPCENFSTALQPRRRARAAVRRHLLGGTTPTTEELVAAGDDPHIVKVFFLAHCSYEKGLFAAARAVIQANATLAARPTPLRMKLIAAGSFVTEREQKDFTELLKLPEFAGAVEHLGFVAGAIKNRALREVDIFCFPTLYMGENQPVNLIEAMAFGLPVVTTRWRSLPEMFPPGYSGLVDNQTPDKIAQALLELTTSDVGEDLRKNFLNQFTLDQHIRNLAAALHELDGPAERVATVPTGTIAAGGSAWGLSAELPAAPPRE